MRPGPSLEHRASRPSRCLFARSMADGDLRTETTDAPRKSERVVATDEILGYHRRSWAGTETWGLKQAAPDGVLAYTRNQCRTWRNSSHDQVDSALTKAFTRTGRPQGAGCRGLAHCTRRNQMLPPSFSRHNGISRSNISL